MAFAFVITANTLSNALPIHGQTMPEISAKYPSLFTPAGFTFSIWGVIYIGLLLFVAWQALPAQRANEHVARISKYFQLNCLMNGLWLVAWHYDWLTLSLVLMFGILATLVGIYRTLILEFRSASLPQRLVAHVPFSLYTGWITLAAIANASVLQTAYGWDDAGIDAVNWTLVKLALAGAIGASVLLKNRDVVFAAVVAWAAWGISVMQHGTPRVAGAAVTLSLLMIMLIGICLAQRLRRAALA